MLFQRICTREWGAAAVWPSRAFAVLVAGPIFTGTYSYAAGFAMLLATIAALQSGRISLAIGCGALTLGFSPLAFIFLVIALAAIAVSRRQVNRRAAALLRRAHHRRGRRSSPPCGSSRWAAATRSAASSSPRCSWWPGSASSSRSAPRAAASSPRSSASGCWPRVALFIIPEPVGENVTRLRSVVFPLMLLTVLVARFRPRGIALVALALALVYNVVPVRERGREPDGGLARLLGRLLGAGAALPARAPRRRVPGGGRPDLRPLGGLVHPARRLPARPRLVPPARHRRERRALPRPALAGRLPPLAPADGRALRPAPLASRSARKAPTARPGCCSTARPASGSSTARPTGGSTRCATRSRSCAAPGSVHVGAFTHDRIAARVTEPGTYRLAVRYMPYWDVKRGAVCVARARDGMTDLRVRRSGRLLLAAADGPTALVRSALGDTDGDCR